MNPYREIEWSKPTAPRRPVIKYRIAQGIALLVCEAIVSGVGIAFAGPPVRWTGPLIANALVVVFVAIIWAGNTLKAGKPR